MLRTPTAEVEKLSTRLLFDSKLRRTGPPTVLSSPPKKETLPIERAKSWRPIICVVLLALLVGCQNHSGPPASRGELSARALGVASDPASNPSRPRPNTLPEEDLLQLVRAMNIRAKLPPATFNHGHVTPLEFDTERVKSTEHGFVIELPSQSPIPTPTLFRGRLYVSGGFSSEEYYCFNAKTGQLIWAKELDDDGPSSAVPYEDLIIFSCESCTLFALDSETSDIRWSHWLGDPLLSMPTVANGLVFVAYPASPDFGNSPAELDGESADEEELRPTHICACLDAKTGELKWRHWIDSDCMSAPIAAESSVFVSSLTGILYQFAQKDGTILTAHRLRATSAPAIVRDQMYLTRRADNEVDSKISECIVRRSLTTSESEFMAAGRPAPYLDQAIQRAASYSLDAAGFETFNGIGGGGFGGGFGGGGQLSIGEENDDPNSPAQSNQETHNDPEPQPMDHVQPLDALGGTELQAAENIGLGNVSTLQNFHGSRVLYGRGRIYSCMGNRLVCVGARTGDELWSIEIEGDLVQAGGHLATPPVLAGSHVLVGTVNGALLVLDSGTGETVHTYEIGSPIRCPPIANGGSVYIATQDGKVVCIHTGNRAITGWPMWGGNPAHQNAFPE